MIEKVLPGRKLVIDLTGTDWPWQQLVAGSSDKVQRLLVGPGIVEFFFEMREDVLCPWTRDECTGRPLPQVNSAVHRAAPSASVSLPKGRVNAAAATPHCTGAASATTVSPLGQLMPIFRCTSP